jgi:hypothetical protein
MSNGTRAKVHRSRVPSGSSSVRNVFCADFVMIPEYDSVCRKKTIAGQRET